MISETGRYGLGPPNDECRPARREDPLRSALDSWLAHCAKAGASPEYSINHYRAAHSRLRRLRPDPEEAAALIAAYADHPQARGLGTFLSACYARSDAHDIVYRGCGDWHSDDIGLRLPAGKRLRVPESVFARFVGMEARGSVVVEGEVKDAGTSLKGVLVLTGETYSAAEIASRGSLAVISGEAEFAGSASSGILILTGAVGELGGLNAGPNKRNALHLVGETASVSSLDATESGFTLSLTDPVKRYSSPHILGPREIDEVPGLAPYLRSLTEPFSPGTPWEAQLAAAEALNKQEVRSTIRGMLKRSGRLALAAHYDITKGVLHG